MSSHVIWPSLENLSPKLERLRANPGSCVTVLIQVDSFGHTDVSSAWLSADERAELKRGLSRLRKKRQAAQVAKP